MSDQKQESIFKEREIIDLSGIALIQTTGKIETGIACDKALGEINYLLAKKRELKKQEQILLQDLNDKVSQTETVIEDQIRTVSRLIEDYYNDNLEIFDEHFIQKENGARELRIEFPHGTIVVKKRVTTKFEFKPVAVAS